MRWLVLATKNLLKLFSAVRWTLKVLLLIVLAWSIADVFQLPEVNLTLTLFPKGPWFYPPDSTMVLLILLFSLYLIAVNRLRESNWSIVFVLLLAVPLFWIMVELPGQWQLHAVCVGFGRPDPECGYVTMPFIAKYGRTTNSLGFATEEVPTTKPPGEFRIVVVGDSSTYGVGLNGAPRYTEYLTQLIVRRGYSHTRVINCGTSGYISLAGARLMARLHECLKPDMLIISYNNDPRGVALHAQIEHELDSPSIEKIRFLFNELELLHALTKLIGNLVYPPQPTPWANNLRWHPEWTRRAYQQLFDLTPGPDVVMLMPLPKPTADEVAYRDQIASQAKNNGSIVVNSFQSWPAHGLTGEFIDDVHPSLRGHQILAQDILQTLEENNFLAHQLSRTNHP